jgi:hypothetical protein
LAGPNSIDAQGNSSKIFTVSVMVVTPGVIPYQQGGWQIGSRSHSVNQSGGADVGVGRIEIELQARINNRTTAMGDIFCHLIFFARRNPMSQKLGYTRLAKTGSDTRLQRKLNTWNP